jgi:deoxyribodipyrimidine photo-lyase
MQSGVTGINTLRIYSPTKQAQDHDPDGMFIRTWIPELADIPDDFIAEPWTTPPIIQNACGCRIGSDYPEPLVDHKTAVAQARQRIGERRKDPVIREQAHAVLLRHGSRKRPERRRPRKQTQD